MANPEIIGLNQLPVIPASELTGEVLIVAVRDGQDVLVNAADIGVESPTKESLGLGQVDNTSDLNKPLSTAAIARFQVIESALSSIDPDAGFDGGNIIGRAEYEADQTAAAQALDVVRNSIPNVDGLVTSEELSAALSGLPGAPDLTPYALKSELPDLTGYAKTADLPAPVDISGLATKTELGDYVKTVDLPAAPDLSNLALKSELPDLTPYAKTADLPAAPDLTGYALKTELPDLTPYAKTADLPAMPDLSGYVTGTALDTALTPYVKAVDLPDFGMFAPITALDGLVSNGVLGLALSAYVRTEDLPAPPDLSGYALKTELPDLTGYAKTADLASQYQRMPTFTLQNVSMNNVTNEITGEVLVDWRGYYCNGMSLDFLVNTEASPFSPPTQPFTPNQTVQSFSIAAQPDRPTQLIVSITDGLSPSFVTDNLIVDFPGV